MDRRRIGTWVGLVGVFFCAVAPTLSWVEFSSGLETLNIGTALELRRDHVADGWLIPTLEGEVRVKKPPLTAWVTAAAIRPETVDALSDPDERVRRAAVDRLAFEARWPALLAACLMIGAVYELGRVVADHETGVVAAVACGTTVLFLRFARTATIDVHLGFLVTVGNVFLAHAVLRGRWWVGCVGAGVALGLAFLTKGPVAWVQSVVPVAAFAGGSMFWARREGRKTERPTSNFQLSTSNLELAESGPLVRGGGVRRWLPAVVVGVLVMVAVALPWFWYVTRVVPEGWETWRTEATETRGERPSKVHGYLALFPYLLPWTIFFVGGVISARRGVWLAVCMAVVPLVVMTFYKDRKERYMYPVVGAACVVAAAGVMTVARRRGGPTGLDKAAIAQHWGLLVVIGVVAPALAATPWVKELTTVTGEPWLGRGWGAGITIALGLVLAGGMLVRGRWVGALTACTAVVMLVVGAAMTAGYARTASGLSTMRPLAEAIWRSAPDAEMYNAHPRGKRVGVDLSIYLNRRTRWVSLDEVAAMRPGARDKVVVMLQDGGTPDPVPPAGWEYVSKIERDRKDWWWAFVLRAGEVGGRQ